MAFWSQEHRGALISAATIIILFIGLIFFSPWSPSSGILPTRDRVLSMHKFWAELAAPPQVDPSYLEQDEPEEIPLHPNATQFLNSESCRKAEAPYSALIELALEPFQELQLESLKLIKHSPSVLLYLQDNRMYVAGMDSELELQTIRGYLDYIHGLTEKVILPNLLMVLSGLDDPAARIDPIFSFCRRPKSHNDLLLANHGEDWLWDGADSMGPSRAGRNDTRLPMIAWFGRPHAWHRGKRKAIVAASLEHPDKVHAALSSWEDLPDWYKKPHEAEWMNYTREGMNIKDWVNEYKYQVNVEGNCASTRLAWQLYSDAAVFLVTSEDQEWYYPLLKPYVHYIPVQVQPDGSTDILEQLEWAESHPDLVEEIVAESTRFATQHLKPASGNDCYSTMLLQKYANRIIGIENLVIPNDTRPYPF